LDLYDYGDDDLWQLRGGYDQEKEYFGYDKDFREAEKCDETLPYLTQWYRGCQTKTRSGKTCQSWSAQEPHSHEKFSENFPGANLEHNYCRNPDGEASIWCYTTDPGLRWEFCDPMTDKDGNLITTVAPKGQDPATLGYAYVGYEEVPYAYGTDDTWWSEHTGDDDGFGMSAMEDFEEIKLEDCNEWFNETDQGKLYRGCQTHTKTGKTCQAWSVQVPHKHDRFSENFPGAGLKTHNYCRNPDGESGIWCYTTDTATRWEYCSPMPNHVGAGSIHLTEADKEKHPELAKKGKAHKRGKGSKAGGIVLLLVVVCGALLALKAEALKEKLAAWADTESSSSAGSGSGGAKYSRVASTKA